MSSLSSSLSFPRYSVQKKSKGKPMAFPSLSSFRTCSTVVQYNFASTAALSSCFFLFSRLSELQSRFFLSSSRPSAPTYNLSCFFRSFFFAAKKIERPTKDRAKKNLKKNYYILNYFKILSTSSARRPSAWHRSGPSPWPSGGRSAARTQGRVPWTRQWRTPEQKSRRSASPP